MKLAILEAGSTAVYEATVLYKLIVFNNISVLVLVSAIVFFFILNYHSEEGCYLDDNKSKTKINAIELLVSIKGQRVHKENGREPEAEDNEI